MTINKNNYEAFFLDYHEGNLSTEQVADVLLFVELHPELKEVFESFESIAIDGFERSEFKNKSSLKKIVLSANTHSEYALSEIDYLLISSLEKTRTESESKQLRQLLKNNRIVAKDAILYAHTVLKPANEVIFEGKERLKKKKAILVPFYYSIAIAASIALIIGVFYFNKMTTPKGNTIAETNKNITNKPIQAIQTENKTAIFTIKKTNKSIHKNSIASNSITIKINTNNSIQQKEPLFFDTTDTTIIPLQIDEQAILHASLSVVDTSNTTKNYTEIKNNIATIETSNNKNDYLSIKELAAQKIKETLLENETGIQKNKKTAKKLNGWDIAQFATKGISKIAGKKIVELTPNYNNNGDVISYALKAGKFEVSKEL